MNNMPGCFGAASVFSHDSEICQKCQAFSSCSEESVRTLEAIKGLVNVADLLKRHEAVRAKKRRSVAAVSDTGDENHTNVAIKPAPIHKPVARTTPVEKVDFGVPVEHEAIIAKLSKKSGECATKLCRHGLIDRIKEDLQAGRNTLSAREPNFIRIAIDGLNAGGFDRRELKAMFIEGSSMGESAAASHVSIALPILFGFGFAQENNGRIVVAPDLGT